MTDTMTLDEFCKALSIEDSRVELIGAFHFFMQKEKKITKATEKTFQNAYKEFQKMPA
jgi:hypothetical protein